MSTHEVAEERRRVRRERAAAVAQSRVSGTVLLQRSFPPLCLSLQFLTQKEFQQIRLERLVASNEPSLNKKRSAEEVLAAEEAEEQQ